jgi:transcription-repair coupling factor (superfamily II helicase)
LPLSALARVVTGLTKGPLKGKKIIAVTPTPAEAEDFLGDLAFFAPDLDCRPFPNLDRTPFMGKYRGVLAAGERIVAAEKLVGGDPATVVASVPALLRKLPGPDKSRERSLLLARGRELGFDELVSFLERGGYERTTQVENPGQYSVRGGLVDLFPVGRPDPLRADFGFDIVESLRSFDVNTQKSTEELREARISPVSQANLDKGAYARAAEKLGELSLREGWMKLLWEPVAEGFKEGMSFGDFENWSPLFEDNLVGFSEYLKEPGIVAFYHEPQRIARAAEAAWIGLSNHFKRLKDEGRPHLPIESLFENPERLLENLFSRKSSVFSREAGITEGDPGDGADGDFFFPALSCRDLRAERNPGRGGSFVSALAGRIKTLLGKAYRITVVTRSTEQARRLAELLGESDLTPAASPRSLLDAVLEGKDPDSRGAGVSRILPGGELRFATGQITAGFVAPWVKEAWISEDDVFGTRKHKRLGAAEELLRGGGFDGFFDLSPGDYVVHVRHGIGQYQGLCALEMSTGYRGDFLAIEYRDGDKLYVPVESFGVVHKYAGASDRPPSLDRLGSASWEKLKNGVKEDLKEKAEELIKLYATRQLAKGRAFPPRDGDFLNFEASFPHEETGDQARAIEDVLRDMEKESPMDRLVCGDVGFGKTEVAMRAAFKAVCGNTQAAVLVPTTILAEQHERSFKERFADWPVEVASVSRLKTPAEREEILERLKLGTVDILIGTTAILRKNVKFRDLGLLVVDEEHRFGVNAKESLKKFRASVDVLSMSATPIPRSLSMSLAGIRDMSIIRTPPVFRLAVKTSLVKNDEAVIREAIDRELQRGGQVFFVHNEIGDIHLWLERLRELMPLVRFGVGHGKQSAAELERGVLKFWKKETDVWITTTIVESGLDFPDANTMIIDRADRLGLAQLYPLKGWVGRGHVQAHCYLMVDSPDTLTANAKKRLRAIMENTDLGSGYRIASHDMQIRGSGNVLGVSQSGQASLVGYEMYAKLMEEAVRELKDEPVLDDCDPEIILGKSAYLPETYVSDTNARIVLYRRLSTVKNEEEIESIRDEMKDRFGALPPEGDNLLELSYLKLMAKTVRAKKLELLPTELRLTFFTDSRNSLDRVSEKVIKTIREEPERELGLSPDGVVTVPARNLRTRELGTTGAVMSFLKFLNE